MLFRKELPDSLEESKILKLFVDFCPLACRGNRINLILSWFHPPHPENIGEYKNIALFNKLKKQTSKKAARMHYKDNTFLQLISTDLSHLEPKVVDFDLIGLTIKSLK